MPADIALNAIVRNEAPNIAGFVASAKAVADELVVVDTGSTDGTQELLRREGATVIVHAWTGDFSAARNEALKHKSAKRVLRLDADERPRGSSEE